MVNWQYFFVAGVGIIISLFFFFASFGFLDENGAYTIGGFGLFIGAIAGFAISIYVIVKGFD